MELHLTYNILSMICSLGLIFRSWICLPMTQQVLESAYLWPNKFLNLPTREQTRSWICLPVTQQVLESAYLMNQQVLKSAYLWPNKFLNLPTCEPISSWICLPVTQQVLKSACLWTKKFLNLPCFLWPDKFLTLNLRGGGQLAHRESKKLYLRNRMSDWPQTRL